MFFTFPYGTCFSHAHTYTRTHKRTTHAYTLYGKRRTGIQVKLTAVIKEWRHPHEVKFSIGKTHEAVNTSTFIITPKYRECERSQVSFRFNNDLYTKTFWINFLVFVESSEISGLEKDIFFLKKKDLSCMLSDENHLFLRNSRVENQKFFNGHGYNQHRRLIVVFSRVHKKHLELISGLSPAYKNIFPSVLYDTEKSSIIFWVSRQFVWLARNFLKTFLHKDWCHLSICYKDKKLYFYT